MEVITICWYCGSVTRGHAVDFLCEQNVISAATWYFIYHYATVYVARPSGDRTTILTNGNLPSLSFQWPSGNQLDRSVVACSVYYRGHWLSCRCHHCRHRLLYIVLFICTPIAVTVVDLHVVVTIPQCYTSLKLQIYFDMALDPFT